MKQLKISVIIVTLNYFLVIDPRVAFFTWDSRVKQILFARDPGRSYARNRAALKSKGDFLVFVDGDALPVKREAWNIIVDSFQEDPYRVVCKQHPVLGSRLLGIKRSLFLSLGGFDECLDVGEDADLGFRIMRWNIPILKIPARFVGHRDHAGPAWPVEDLCRARNKIRFLLRYRKIWIRDRVLNVSPGNVLRLFLSARKRGVLNVVRFAESVCSFMLYLFWDNSKILEYYRDG